MSFTVPQDELVANLLQMKKRICCYMGPTCDCKFGGTGIGEQTGCPEVSVAAKIIGAMSPEMFQTMLGICEIIDTQTLAEALKGQEDGQNLNPEAHKLPNT